MRYRIYLGVGALVALLGACASTPQHDDQLDAARVAVQRLEQNPLAAQVAARDLQEAHKRLGDAEAAFEQKRPPEVVDHYAYLARRHAEAGEARVASVRYDLEARNARDERTRLLLAARTREAQKAQDAAENAAGAAQAAQAQLEQARRELADLKATQTERGTVVTLGDVLFDTGGATLKPGADLSLDRLAKYMKDHPGTKLLIEGHTDSRGSDEYNEALSERRAQAVADALTTRGVPSDAIRTRGRGKSYPVASNDTPEGRQQNRRVEIVFSDNSGHFAESESGGGAVQR